jgi:hypothetical protein
VVACDPGAGYATHGEFVRCVSHECRASVGAGLLSPARCDALISEASRSSAGKRN